MAVPSYTTDLSVHDDASAVTNWDESSNNAWDDSAPPAVDTDLAIYGSQCITADRHNTGVSTILADVAARTLGTNHAFFIWTKFHAPNSQDTLANGGVRVVIGDTLGDFYGWYVDGSDTYTYGGWVNYAVDPDVTADVTVGTPDDTWVVAGIGWKCVNQISKGNPMQVDIIRYGRGESRFTGGESSDYATIAGYAAVNDNATTGRFGLLQAISGGYLFKGLMSLGLTATAVDMRDSNVTITIDNTRKVGTAFNRIEVHNASSNVEWSGFTISKVGTVSKGQFEMIANATVVLDACTFVDMDTFIFQSNGDLDGCTFRRCGQVTAGSADFDGCLFTNTTAATALLAGSSVATISDCDFISDGSSHG
ncbi:MAG: hypothetical protein U9Q61_01290, partial [Thermodesulfobacteriota bacterium]|nr:hypothetical protein [Thermodesulfobacteriota bacterium]